MGGQTKAVSDPKYYMQFEACTLPIKLTWYPQATLMAIAANAWPNEIELHEDAIHPRYPTFGVGSRGAKNLHALSLQASFIRFFESYKGRVSAQFGSDPMQWPNEWNFARIIRNAFAHDGVITFANPNASAVEWRGIKYGPTAQGRQVIFQDMSFVEILVLMEDMNAHL